MNDVYEMFSFLIMVGTEDINQRDELLRHYHSIKNVTSWWINIGTMFLRVRSNSQPTTLLVIAELILEQLHTDACHCPVEVVSFLVDFTTLLQILRCFFDSYIRYAISSGLTLSLTLVSDTVFIWTTMHWPQKMSTFSKVRVTFPMRIS
jgi:hypothetical protein